MITSLWGLDVRDIALRNLSRYSPQRAALTTSLTSSSALYAACASCGFTCEYKKLGTGELPMTPLIALYTSITLEVGTDAMAFPSPALIASKSDCDNTPFASTPSMAFTWACPC